MRKLGATTTLFAGDEEVIVQATVRVTWGKGTQGFELCILKKKDTENYKNYRI